VILPVPLFFYYDSRSGRNTGHQVMTVCHAIVLVLLFDVMPL
jgi:hypothetical protein